MDALGSITWWGFSPALDLQDEDLNRAVSKMKLDSVNQDVLRVLMIGAGDLRHVLTTISRCHRHRHTKIHFYLLESSMEVYARHILFLTLALEQQHRMGLQEKTELFLELYGNSLVREQSIKYVEKMSTMFIKMVTDFDYMEKKLPVLDMSLLKFKERDFLEAIFKFWRNTDRQLFDIEKAWDLRLRKHLGVRYDAIPNVFDWDLSMKLHEKGASIIHPVHYKQWRGKGLAFEIREGTYDVPNRTLASGMVFKHEGERVARRGYWGDILVSPYITFGISCEEKAFFKKSNNAHTQTSQDVSEYNIISIFHELTHKTRFELPQVSSDKPADKGPTLTEITEEDEEQAETPGGDEPDATTNPLDLDYEPINIDHVKVHFLPLNGAADLSKKSKFKKFFNSVYISNSMVHHLTPSLTETFADTAPVILETSKFMIELNNDQHKQFLDKIVSIAKSVGCQEADSPDLQNSHAEFVFQRKTADS